MEVYAQDFYVHDESLPAKKGEHFSRTKLGTIRLHFHSFTCEGETVKECREKEDKWLNGERFGFK